MSQPKTLLITERFRVEEITRELPGGGSRTRAVVRHPGAVAIIPMVDDHHVCLIENYRVTVGAKLLEIPAGTLEAGESPLETAQRELWEETGYRAHSLDPLTSFYLSPGIMDERMHLFVATGLMAGESARELGEEIENRVIPWQDALAMIFAGHIVDAKSIAGLLYYESWRKRGM